MVSYLALAFAGLAVAYVANTYRCFAINLAAAKKSGLPYICMPVVAHHQKDLPQLVDHLDRVCRHTPALRAILVYRKI
jgi:hypothetical protein